MPGESEAISQGDIEQLLRKAQAAAGGEQPMPARQVTDDMSFLLSQAEAALASVDEPANPDLAGLAPFELRDFGGSPASGDKATLALLSDVELDVKIELGRSQMNLEDVLRLKKGSVVALDKLAGDPVDIYVNGRLIARGEVLVLNDNFCVRVAELLSGEETKAA
jgi:flagellar motor switch protein FliN/FliY